MLLARACMQQWKINKEALKGVATSMYIIMCRQTSQLSLFDSVTLFAILFAIQSQVLVVRLYNYFDHYQVNW
jgi:hypothetical protein